MGGQRHMAKQIIYKLREADVLQAKGMSLERVLQQRGPVMRHIADGRKSTVDSEFIRRNG